MATILGTPWADRIRGTNGSDSIYAWGGNDLIFGSAGADYLDGGAGIDTVDYSGSWSHVEVDLATGQGTWADAAGDMLVSIENVTGSLYGDVLKGDGGSNVLTGLAGDDVLQGGAGADKLLGGDGNDLLRGGSGADLIDGGAGTDWAQYFGSSAGVTILLYTDQAGGGDAEGDQLNGIENVSGSFYADTLWGDDGANTLAGGYGNDTLKGFGGADLLAGNEGDDDLFGMDGDDRLTGQDGNDTLNGGAGRDRLSGEAGADSFDWNSTAETGVTIPTMDMIGDFNFAQGDRINLGGIDADVYAAGNQAFTFIGTAAFSGTPGEINYYHDGNTTIIQLQTGTGADIEGGIVLQGLHTPDASWFVL